MNNLGNLVLIIIIIYIILMLKKNNGKKKYSNEEVRQIREYLYLLAQLQIESENELVNLNN